MEPFTKSFLPLLPSRQSGCVKFASLTAALPVCCVLGATARVSHVAAPLHGVVNCVVSCMVFSVRPPVLPALLFAVSCSVPCWTALPRGCLFRPPDVKDIKAVSGVYVGRFS